MLRTILIGIDGSPYSAAAIELGIRWAGRYDCLLVGLGVVDEPTIRSPSAVPLGAGGFKGKTEDARLAEARHRVDGFLEQFTFRCTEAQVSHKLFEDVGAPYERIVLQAQRYDLILLGQETHFHFETQDRPCDTLEQVVKNAPRPVVAVPLSSRPGQSIVVAYDGSLQAARALQTFQQSGLGDTTPIHVLSAADAQVDAARIASRAVEFLDAHGLRATPHALESSDKPSQVILHQAGTLDAGLIVMGAYGRSLLHDFFLGSTTRRVIQDTTAPLFLYH